MRRCCAHALLRRYESGDQHLATEALIHKLSWLEVKEWLRFSRLVRVECSGSSDVSTNLALALFRVTKLERRVW